MKLPKILLLLVVLIQMLQSCESDDGFRQRFVQIRTTLVNQKSDSIKVKFDYERQYKGSAVFHHNFTILPGAQYIHEDQIPDNQSALFIFTFYITDVHGKIDTVSRKIYVEYYRYRRNISETIIFKD